MPFPQRLLTDGEQVVVELRPHMTALGWSLPAAGGAVALLVAQVAAWTSAPSAFTDALLVVVGATLLWLGGRWLRLRTTSLVVTTNRLVQRSGVLGRRGLDIRLERINDISYQQTILGRVLGVGRLTIDRSGDAGRVAFDHIRRPAAVAGLLHEQIAELAARGSDRGARHLEEAPHVPWRRRGRSGAWRHGPDDTPPAGMPLGGIAWDGDDGRSIRDQLVELDELRRRGIVTDDEFARKKAELLDRM